MITQPHRSEEVVTIDRRTEQTMRAWMDDITDQVNILLSSGGGGGALTETEIDFGTAPVRSKKFTVVDGTVTGSSKIIVSPSGNVGTGRVGDDWEWDSVSLAAKAGTGSFTISAHASGRIRGNRKVYYSVG